MDAPEMPDTIGPYQIVRLLGMGGMAQVYQARKVVEGVGLVVALKIPRQHIVLDGAARQRFLREARITARLGSHANIVQVLDVGLDGDLPYMAMEYVTGVDLGQLCGAMTRAGTRWSEPAILWVLASLIQGLKHAWGAEVEGKPLRIVHRDISPQNVLLTHEGYVKLTDFGISRMAGLDTSGMIRGKARYMPVEQLQGRASSASDLYAVGAIGWELIEGKKFRHDKKTHDEMYLAAFAGERPTIERTDVSPRLRQLVHDLIDPNAETRIQNPMDAWAELKACPGLNLADPDPVRMLLEEYYGHRRRSGYTQVEMRIHPELVATRAALAAAAAARGTETLEGDEGSSATIEGSQVLAPGETDRGSGAAMVAASLAVAGDGPATSPPPGDMTLGGSGPPVEPTEDLGSSFVPQHGHAESSPIPVAPGSAGVDAQPMPRSTTIPAPIEPVGSSPIVTEGSEPVTATASSLIGPASMHSGPTLGMSIQGSSRTLVAPTSETKGRRRVGAWIAVVLGVLVIVEALVLLLDPFGDDEAEPAAAVAVAAPAGIEGGAGVDDGPEEPRPTAGSGHSERESSPVAAPPAPDAAAPSVATDVAQDEPGGSTTAAPAAPPDPETSEETDDGAQDPAATTADDDDTEGSTADEPPPVEPSESTRAAPKAKPKVKLNVRLDLVDRVDLRLGSTIKHISGPTTLRLRPGRKRLSVRTPGSPTWYSQTVEIEAGREYLLRLSAKTLKLIPL